jgi:hypothetical protein
MVVLALALVVTNLVTLTALVRLYLQPLDLPGPDPAVAAELDTTPAAGRTPSTRRLISIEILNPAELAATRGRLAGLAGSVAPKLTQRIVYDQTVKILREQLVAQQVVADVRLHTLRPSGARGPEGPESV